MTWSFFLDALGKLGFGVPAPGQAMAIRLLQGGRSGITLGKSIISVGENSLEKIGTSKSNGPIPSFSQQAMAIAGPIFRRTKRYHIKLVIIYIYIYNYIYNYI
jgi:hypothetical protein